MSKVANTEVYCLFPEESKMQGPCWQVAVLPLPIPSRNSPTLWLFCSLGPWCVLLDPACRRGKSALWLTSYWLEFTWLQGRLLSNLLGVQEEENKMPMGVPDGDKLVLSSSFLLGPLGKRSECHFIDGELNLRELPKQQSGI